MVAAIAGCALSEVSEKRAPPSRLPFFFSLRALARARNFGLHHFRIDFLGTSECRVRPPTGAGAGGSEPAEEGDFSHTLADCFASYDIVLHCLNNS